MKSLRPITAFGLIVSCLVLLVGIAVPHAAAWSSKEGNPFEAIHTRITKDAIDRCSRSHPESQSPLFKEALIEGANMELHELASTPAAREIGTGYRVNVEQKRIRHGGTNEGCNHIEGWWQDALAAYKAGNKKQAYFVLGIMLHMIEDMGVPAHAKGLYHQGNATEFDNFEFMALTNWKPNFDPFKGGTAQKDPLFKDPSKYYAFSRAWTLSDAPHYNNTHTFSKAWAHATLAERQLMSNRQGRTCIVTYWALNSACKAFALTQ